MPRNEPCPRFWLCGAVDINPWDGVNVLDLGAANVVLSADPATGGIHQDMTMFLNGHGSFVNQATWINYDYIAANPAGAVNWTCGIDANDKFYIENDTYAFSVEDQTTVGGNQGWGFPSGVNVVAVNTGGTVWRATAPNDWERGNLNPTTEVYVTVSLPDNDFYITGRGQVQDLPILVRSDFVPDADSLALEYNLQWFMNDAAGTNKYVVGVTDRGHVFIAYTVIDSPVTWVSTSFRDFLGFDGTETPAVFGVVWRILTSKYPCSTMIAPSRPLDSITAIGVDESKATYQTDSGMSTNYIGTYIDWAITGYLDGPADDWDDLHQHFVRRVLPSLGLGQQVRLYQDAGDSRRALERGDYGILYTPEMNHYRGAIVGRVHGTNTQEFELSWTGQAGNLRMRAPLFLRIRETLY